MKIYLYKDLYLLENNHWWHVSKRRIVRYMIEKYGNQKNPIILDMGCGTGKNIEELQKLGRIYGLDSSPEALTFCKKRGLRNLLLGSAEKTPFKKGAFNMITMLDILEHTDDNTALKESYRILKKDGLLIITVPAFNWLWSKWDVVLHHKRRYTKSSLISILEKNNFQIKKISYMYFYLILPVFFIRMIKSLGFGGSYPSDFKLSSPIINRLMNRITKAEFFFIKFTSIPFGTSIIAVAQKNEL